MKIRFAAALLVPAVAGIAIGALVMPATLEPASAFAIPADSITIGNEIVDSRKIASDLRSDLNDRAAKLKAEIAKGDKNSKAVSALAAKISAEFDGHSAVTEAEMIARLGLLTAKKSIDGLQADFAKASSTIDSLSSEWASLLKSEAAARAKAEAEKKAADEAAAEEKKAVEQQETQQDAPRPSGTAPSAAPAGNFTLRIAGSGGQELIDACAGAVWWTPWPGVLAEHWHCGGASFPKDAGVLVDIPGAGTYKTVGIVAVVNGPQSDTSAIPTGYDLVYQTCLNNDNTTTGFVGLIKV